jgi:hypothetical protein
MPVLMRELWAPSMELAQDAMVFLFEKLEWAIRERALAGSILPYGIDTGLKVAFDVAYLNFNDYDRRADLALCQEAPDEEPVSHFRDNFLPKCAPFRSDYTGIISRPLNN